MPHSDPVSGSLTSSVLLYTHQSEVVPSHINIASRHKKVESYTFFSVMKMLENITIIIQCARCSANLWRAIDCKLVVFSSNHIDRTFKIVLLELRGQA